MDLKLQLSLIKELTSPTLWYMRQYASLCITLKLTSIRGDCASTRPPCKPILRYILSERDIRAAGTGASPADSKSIDDPEIKRRG